MNLNLLNFQSLSRLRARNLHTRIAAGCYRTGYDVIDGVATERLGLDIMRKSAVLLPV